MKREKCSRVRKKFTLDQVVEVRMRMERERERERERESGHLMEA